MGTFGGNISWRGKVIHLKHVEFDVSVGYQSEAFYTEESRTQERDLLWNHQHKWSFIVVGEISKRKSQVYEEEGTYSETLWRCQCVKGEETERGRTSRQGAGLGTHSFREAKGGMVNSTKCWRKYLDLATRRSLLHLAGRSWLAWCGESPDCSVSRSGWGRGGRKRKFFWIRTKGQEGKGEKGIGKRGKSWPVKAAKGKKEITQ